MGKMLLRVVVWPPAVIYQKSCRASRLAHGQQVLMRAAMEVSGKGGELGGFKSLGAKFRDSQSQAIDVVCHSEQSK